MSSDLDFISTIPNHMSFGKVQDACGAGGSINKVQFRPVSGENFSSNQTFSINVASTTDWLIPSKSWVSFDIKLVGAAVPASNPTTTNCWTSLGGAAVFEAVKETVSGVPLQELQHYPSFINAIYGRMTTTQKNLMTQLEHFNDGTFLTANTTALAGTSIQHSLRTSIMSSEQCIPLSFLSGGITWEFRLADYRSCISDNSSGATDYVISNVRFNACLLTPTAAVNQAMLNSLSNGSVAKIPLSVIRNQRLTVNQILQQNIKMTPGYQSSLRKIIGVQSLVANTNVVTADQYNSTTINNNSLGSYRVEVGSVTYPKNYYIKTGNASLMNAVSSIDANYSSFNSDLSGDQFISYAWDNGDAFGAGIPVQDGSITVALVYNTTPALAYLDVFLNYDGMLSIGLADVSFTSTQY